MLWKHRWQKKLVLKVFFPRFKIELVTLDKGEFFLPGVLMSFFGWSQLISQPAFAGFTRQDVARGEKAGAQDSRPDRRLPQAGGAAAVLLRQDPGGSHPVPAAARPAEQDILGPRGGSRWRWSRHHASDIQLEPKTLYSCFCACGEFFTKCFVFFAVCLGRVSRTI